MTLKDITVKQYFDILDLIENEKDPVSLNAEIVKIIWDVDAADIPYVEFINRINELKFLTEEYVPAMPKEVVIDGIKFHPVLDMSKITTAQYIDFQEFLKRNDHKKLLNVFFVTDEGYGKDYSDLLWEKLSAKDYLDYKSFFLLLLRRLTADSLLSSEKMMKKMYKKEKDQEKKRELLEKIAKIRLARNEVDFPM